MDSVSTLVRLNGNGHALSSAGDHRSGEVVAASTTEFTAEASELHGAPPFGSLVKVVEPGRPTIYGLVSHAETGGLDPSRRAVARGLPPSMLDGQIYDEYPELRDVLRTEFTARVVGFADTHGNVRHWLPPYPASMHYSVVQCPPQELVRFTERHDYLAAVLADAEGSIELVAAAIRESAAVRDNAMDYLLGAGRAVAALLSADYQRLLLILQRIAPQMEV
ncbi:MAG: hypothetical protein ACR2JY_03730 [Chloroflexota bacterium]